MTPVRLGSLCSGAGMLDLAIKSLIPVEHTWHVEKDEAASAVLAAHWPGTPNHEDLTTVSWADLAAVDIVAGGWPCQPFSGAGKRGGSADERHLWPYVFNGILTLRPRLFIGENVQGILTIENGRVFGQVLADLTGAGYRVSWTTVGACKVGAAHHRHRVFIAATLAECGPPDGALFGLPHASAGKWPPAGFARDGLVWEMPADACGADGVVLPTPVAGDADRVSATYSRGNPTLLGAFLPTPRTSDTAGPGEHGSGGMDLRTAVSLLPTPKSSDADRGDCPSERGRRSPSLVSVAPMLPTPTVTNANGNKNNNHGDLLLPGAVCDPNFGSYAAAVARQERAFGLPAPAPTELGTKGQPRLSPMFTEWLVGLPAGWITNHVGRSAAIKIAGNGVVQQAATYALGALPTFRAFLEEHT